MEQKRGGKEQGPETHSPLCAGCQWWELKLDGLAGGLPSDPSLPMEGHFSPHPASRDSPGSSLPCCQGLSPLRTPGSLPSLNRVQQKYPQPPWALCAFCMTIHTFLYLRQSIISLVKIPFTIANAFLCIVGFELLIFCCGFHRVPLSDGC